MADAAAARPRGARLSLSTILAFAATSLPLSAMTIAIAVYLPQYYARNLGVSLAVVGSVFAIIRLIDIPLDPMLGLVMDRTRTKWGRYRVWTVIGAPVLMAAVFALFMAPNGVGPVYLGFWLLIMYLGTSILHLSHAAWAATLATNYDERSRVFGWMTAVGVAGSVMVLFMPQVTRMMGMGEEGVGVQAMGWFVLALTPLAVALVVWRTPETITRDVHGQQFQLKDYLSLVTRPEMARILAADLCLALGPGWMSALYMFYFTDGRGYTTAQASLLLAIYILAGFAGAPLMGRLAMRISKHRAAMVATTGYSVSLMVLPFIGRGDFLIGALQMFWAGFLAAGFTVLIRAMTADVADDVRLEQGKERSGLLYALTTLTNKIAGAFSIFLTFQVLARIGFQAEAGAVNSPEQIRALELAFLIGPIVFVMLGGACFIGYRLGADRHAEIRRKLDERDALYDEAPIIDSVGAPADTSVPTPLIEPKKSAG